MSSAPFHVAEIFDDVDDMAWYSSTLITDVVDFHAPMKSKFVKFKPVAYMNSKLRKALYARNMARNKLKKFGKSHWEENRRERNKSCVHYKTIHQKLFLEEVWKGWPQFLGYNKTIPYGQEVQRQ